MTGFGIAILAVVILALLWAAVRPTRRSPWVRAAERLGLHPRGASMEGTIAGLPVHVHASEPVRQRTAQATAHIHCALPLPLDLGLSIRAHGQPTQHLHGEELLEAGPGPFHADFEVLVDDAARAHSLLGEELCDAVSACATELDELTVCDDGVRGELAWGVGAVERLRHAVESAARVAAELDRVRHQIPVAPALAEHRSGWSAFAGAHELDYSTTPLAVQGIMDSMGIVAIAERLEPASYRLVVKVSFAEPLGFGLTVTPRRRRSRRRRRRSRGGHSRFARRFEVTADDVWGVDQLLDRSVRQALMALREETGPVWLADDVLQVHRSEVPLRREVLDHIVRSAAAVAKLIESRAHGGAAHRSPYR